MSLMLEDVIPAAPPPPPAAAAAPGAPQADWTVVRGSLAAIESARSQVDVLSRFLTRVNAHASRVALLVLRNDRLTGWKSVGFDASGGRDEAVRALDLGGEDDPFVAALLKSQHSMLAEPPDESGPLRRALSGQAPARTLLVPMVIRDRLAGIVCADELPGEEGRLNEAAVEVLTFVTGLAVDLLAARKKIPSPSLTPTGEAIPRFEPPSATVRAAAADFEIATPSSRPAPSGAGPFDRPPAPTQRSRSTDAGEALRAIEEAAKTRIPQGLRSFSSDPGLTSAIPTIGAAPAPPPPSFPSFPSAPAVAPAPPPLPGPAPSPLANASTGDFTGAFEALRASGRVPLPGEADVTAQKPVRPTSAVMPPRDLAGTPGRSRASCPGAAPQRPRPTARSARSTTRAASPVSSSRRSSSTTRRKSRTAAPPRTSTSVSRTTSKEADRSTTSARPRSIRQDTDFFHDELVRILADGRAEALGSVS